MRGSQKPYAVFVFRQLFSFLSFFLALNDPISSLPEIETSQVESASAKVFTFSCRLRTVTSSMMLVFLSLVSHTLLPLVPHSQTKPQCSLV